MRDMKIYQNLDVHLKKNQKIEFECTQKQGHVTVNGNRLKRLYGQDVFSYGNDLKFKPYVYYSFATPSNGREFLII